MKPIIVTADNHLTAARPARRTDDWVAAEFRKLSFIMEEAARRRAIIACAGDMFDKASGPLWFLNAVIDLFYSHGIEWWTVAGNHDQHFHNPSIRRTQMGNMELSGAVKILDQPLFLDGAVLYGRSWNEPYPEIWQDPSVDHYISEMKKILIAHATVTRDMPPPWLSAQSAREFIEAHPGFDYIVTGDFHEKFVVEHNGCTLVNTGPMMRSSIDKRDFEPSIWLIDDSGVTEIPIPIEPDVFDLAAVEAAAEMRDQAFSKELMERFLGSLDFADKERPSFAQIVNSGLDKLENAELIETIKEIMDHVEGKD